jgi:ribosomal protein L11 methyltransferase
LIRLAIRCRPEHAEVVLAELLELAPGGVEEDASNPGPPPEVWADDDGRPAADPVPAASPADPGREAEESTGSDFVEYAIYGAPGELPALPDLKAVVGDLPIEIETTEIPDDWADRWRDFHEPAVISAGRLVVQPSWIEADTSSQASGAVSIVIDPGQAFGTGAHATTQLSLELLLALADAGHASGPIVDLGTGSAVLAIAAAKLGWAPVSAVDHEEAAVAAARENAALNHVEIAVERRNLRQSPPPAAPTIVANLTAPLLGLVAGWLERDAALVPDRLVCSGLLLGETEGVVTAFQSCGLREVERRAGGDWAGLSFERA